MHSVCIPFGIDNDYNLLPLLTIIIAIIIVIAIIWFYNIILTT